MTAWCSTIHKMASIKYSEYDQETGKVSFQDKMNGDAIGSKSQEVIAEGLLDLSILDKPPEIHKGSMAGGKYYNSKNEDMSRGSMNTEAWHGRSMGLKHGLEVRASPKRGNGNNIPVEGSNTTADDNVCSDAEDTNTA